MTTSPLLRLTVLAAALAFGAAAQAGSFASSASSAGSASLKGSSDSIKGSSNSISDDKTAMVKDGAYRVAQVEAGESGQLLLTLEPQNLADAQTFQLQVPMQAFGGTQPTTGELVQAQRRGYGVQFARGTPQEPFLIVLADAVHPELSNRPLTP